MKESEIHHKLMERAGKLLSRRPHSRSELAARLSKYYGPEKAMEDVLNRLQELNLLNDAEYAYNFAKRRFEQDGWGPLKIEHHLLRRKIVSELVEEAIQRVRGEIGEESILERCLDRYFQKNGLPESGESVRNLVFHLRQSGFTDEVIYDTLRHRIAPSVRSQFESGE